MDRAISRRKQTNPDVNVNMAAMKKNEMIPEGSLLSSEPINNAAITMQISNALVVHRVIAQ